MFKYALLIFSLSIAVACAHHSFLLTSKDTTTIQNTIKVSGTTVSDKVRKYSVKMYIENVSDKHILVLLNSIKCFKGNVRGTIQHAFFGAGERYMDFAPGESKPYHLLCYFNGAEVPLGSDYRFEFSVWDNPSKDRKTPGDRLVEDGKWVIKYREAG